jgi:hypothetical protein
MAGSLVIFGTTYALKAKQTPMKKERFVTKVRNILGGLVVNNMGNAAKRTWQYSGECDVSVCTSLETALDSGTTGSFTDHTGTAYSSCHFEFEYNASGYWKKCAWTLLVEEV